MNPAALHALLLGQNDNFIAASTPGGIERQEKQGQIDQSFRETLPIKGTEDRASWKAMGFVFGSNEDDLFVNVKFPDGWKKKPTDHSMWTDLVDDRGRKRGAIFYKAAFYDRSSHIHLSRRFSISSYDDGSSPETSVVSVKDGDSVIKSFGEYETRNYHAGKQLQAQAEKWLNDNHPSWESVSAYWTE